jgi:DeoR/GlpR family transcriptional regulator of sugar metabolism
VFAPTILPGLQLTVATHDPSIAACLVGQMGIDMVVAGGSIHPQSGAALSGRAMQEILGTRPDLLILGACPLHAEQGMGAFNSEDAHMKGLLIEHAGSVAVGLLNEKLRSIAAHTVAPINSISDAVVEADAPVFATSMLAYQGVRVHRADAASSEQSGQPKKITRRIMKGIDKRRVLVTGAAQGSAGQWQSDFLPKAPPNC